jgi:DNA-binding NarL/FixJ family response regulator
MKHVRLIIADSYPVFREGLSRLLEEQGQFEVVAQADDAATLWQLVKKDPPDVVILDLNISDSRGSDIIKELKTNYPKIGIIALAMSEEDQLIFDSLKAGVNGYLLKNTTTEEIINAARSVYNGGLYFCDLTAMRLIKRLESGENTSVQKNRNKKFSPRELEVMQLICQERSSKQIAHELRLSLRTVESIREKIVDKTGAVNMAGIVLYAIRNGIYKIEQKKEEMNKGG